MKINELQKEIIDVRKQIKDLESLATSINCELQQDKVQSSPRQDKLESLVVKIADLKNYLQKLEDQYEPSVTEMLNGIENGTEYNILFRRYVLFQQWTTIESETGYSHTRVMEINRKIT